MARSRPLPRPAPMFGPIFSHRFKAATALALAVCAAVASAPPSALAQRAAPPAFVDERRLPPTDAEIKAKAEEQKRQAAEAEARQRAEDQKRQAAEAEARQRAEEQRRQSAEAEAKQKAEEQRRQSTEAEARQRAEEQRRQSAEAEAKQKVEEQRRQAAEAEARQKAVKPAPAPVPAVRAAADCGADRISARAISGGRVQIEIETPCRPGQKVALRYGAFDLQRQLDGAGRGTIILDLFQGKSPAVSLQIGTGPPQSVSLDAVDMAGLSKVAVIWQAPVNLDLHIYEYAARHGESGHVWPGAPSSADAAEAEARASKRGRGFLSTSDDGRGDGEKVEVYTFWHHAGQQSGLVATALDYETRGASPNADTCGSGAHATVVYETFILDTRAQLSRERGAIAPATCGSQLTGAGRYMEDAVPDLSAMP